MGHLKCLKVGFFDLGTGKRVPTDSKDALGRIELELTDRSQESHVH